MVVLVLAPIVCVCVFCVVGLHTSDCLCLFGYFRDVIRDLIPLVCASPSVVCIALVCTCPSVRIPVCVPASRSVVASPWSVFLFSGSAARAGGQALHHAGQR